MNYDIPSHSQLVTPCPDSRDLNALAFAKNRAMPLRDISIKELRPSVVSQWIVDASITLGWYSRRALCANMYTDEHKS